MVSLITRTNLNLQAENKRLMQELETALETERRNREQQQKKVAALKEELLSAARQKQNLDRKHQDVATAAINLFKSISLHGGVRLNDLKKLKETLGDFAQ